MITSSIKNLCHSIKWAFTASDSIAEPFLYTADFMVEEGWPGLITPPAPNYKLSKSVRSIFKPTNSATSTTTTSTTNSGSNSSTFTTSTTPTTPTTPTTSTTTNRKSTQNPNTSFSPSLVTHEMFEVAKVMEHKAERRHVVSVETVPALIPDVKNIALVESIIYPIAPQPKIDTSSIISGCQLFTEKKLAFSNGLKSYHDDDDICRLCFECLKEKVLKKSENLHPLPYFQCHYNEDQYSFEFESLNHEDFKSIRGYLGIKEDKFENYFDRPFYDKENEAFDLERSTNGRFRINIVFPEQAYFLHTTVKAFKRYFKYHRNTSLQCFVGLYRVGGTYFAVEDLRPGRLPLNYSLHVSKRRINLTTEWCQDIEILRASTFRSRSELKKEKKILFSDLKFLKRIHPSFEVINLGIAKTDK